MEACNELEIRSNNINGNKIETTKRLKYMDIAKGIGIILMVLGHMPLSKYPYVYNFIFSFHMPLFFLISGYFFKGKSDRECLKNIFKRCIIPYIVTCLIIIFYKVLRLIIDGNYSEILETLKVWGLASIYGSGSREQFGIKRIGAVWFLLALAFSTYFFNKIYNKKYSCLYVMVIAYIGFKTSQYIWLPFSIQAGMVALIFMYIGNLAKKYDVLNKKISILTYIGLILIVLFCIIYGGKLYMVSNVYKNGIMDIIGAVSGSFLCIKISMLIERYTKVLKRIFIFIGKNSLICLCLHLISLNCFYWKTLKNILCINFKIQSETLRAFIINIGWVVIMLVVIELIKKLYRSIRKKDIGVKI